MFVTTATISPPVLTPPNYYNILVSVTFDFTHIRARASAHRMHNNTGTTRDYIDRDADCSSYILSVAWNAELGVVTEERYV